MRKLVFFVVWLALSTSHGYGENIKSELDAELDRITQDYLTSLSLAHSRTPTRRKRDLDSSHKPLIIDDTGVDRLQTVTPVSMLCSPALFTQFLDVGSDTFAVCVSQKTDDHPAEVIIGLYKEHVYYVLNSWMVSSPRGLSAFHFNEHIYVLIADDTREGVELYKYEIATRNVGAKHVVSTKHYTTTINIWKMKEDSNFHLAIGNSPAYNYLDNFITEIEVYKWKDTYFDRYDVLSAYDVKDIEPFHIHGTAYLAIANFRKGKLSYDVDSEIFKYDLDKKKWISHQRIRTYGATDWEFFTLGSDLNTEFFLVVANAQTHKGYQGATDSTAVVYKFVKDQFVPFQCLPTFNARAIASWSTQKMFLLAVAGYEAVNLYQYDGWNFVYSATQYTQGSMSNYVNRMTFHNVYNNDEKTLVLSVSNPGHPREYSVFELGFYHENYLQNWNAKSTEWCLNTMNKLESSSAGYLSSLLDDVIFMDQKAPITINGSLIFESGFETNRLKTPMLKEIITEEIYDGKMLHTLLELHEKLQLMSEKLAEFDKVLKNALRISGEQTVHGRLEFKDVSFDCKETSCKFDRVDTQILNGEEIVDWASNLVFLDRDQVIKGPIFAQKIEAEDVIVHGMIDGVYAQYLVTKSGSHTITAPKIFEGLVTTPDLEVAGFVDGVKISPLDILLTTGYQTVTGDLTFDEMEVSWMNVSESVNGINLAEFYDDVVLSDQPASITGEKVFENIIAEDLVLIPGSTINGVDIVDLWKNALWLKGEQEITAQMNFESVNILGELFAFKGINDIQIPGPRVVNINSLANVSEHHTFDQSTKIDELVVLGSLNGIETYLVSGKFPQLDIMLKTADHEQVITGEKTFSKIHLDGDSQVTGTVDGVDLSMFKQLALNKDPRINQNRTWIFKNLVIKGSLKVNKLSGYDIASLYERALKLTDLNIPEITFMETIYIEDLVSRNINGYDIENDFVLSNKDQEITGKKTFEHIVLEENNVKVGFLNNINLNFFNETILLIGNQEIKKKVFNSNVKFNKLTVTGSINGVQVSDLATITGNNTLNAEELRSVTFNVIEANDFVITGNVNGINVQDMIDDTLTSDGFQTVTGKKTIKGTIRVNKGDFLNVGKINGIDINELWEDLVLKDVPQDISGVKTFENSVAFDNLVFESTIDGVSQTDMDNWMLKDKPQVVEGDVVFWETVAVENLDVKGLINDLDIQELEDSIVKVNEPNVIEGHVTFENLQVFGNITLSGKIQGVDLSEEAVTKSGDKVVTGKKTFVNELIVNGDASVVGTVDGIKIQDLCHKAMLLGKEQTINSLTIKGDVVISGGGTVQGKVAGVNLDELRDLALTGESQVNLGVKTFQDLTIEGTVTLDGLLGGVNLTLLDLTYLSLTRPQTIPADMSFDDIVFKDVLKANEFSTVNKVVNGLNLSNIDNRILMNTEDQTVTVEHHFDEVIFEDVFVLGKVNGLDLSNGIMRRDQVNFIRSPKLFEKPVTVTGDLFMTKGEINNVDVSQWFSKAVMKNGGKFVIDGHKTFETLSVTDAKVHGKLDGLEISDKKLLMKYGDQIVTGKKTVLGDVEIRGHVTLNGFVNGIDLERLSEKTLRLDRSNIVDGAKYFTRTLTIHNLTAPSIAGVDIEELQEKVHRHIDWGNLPLKLNEINTAIKGMEDALNKQAVVFQYYELSQSFRIPTACSWLYASGHDIGELLLLTEYSSETQCSAIVLYSYDSIQKEFQRHPFSQELVTSSETAVKSMYLWNTTYLFVANKVAQPHCTKYQSKIEEGKTTGDVYTWTENGFEISRQIVTFPLEDLVVFFDGNLGCVVFISRNNPEVYCSKGVNQEFQHYGSIKAKGAKKASILNANGEIYLAVVIENSETIKTYTEERPVEVYMWNRNNFEFENPVVPLMSTYAQSVQLMSYNQGLLSTVFLAISEGPIPKIQNEPKILIYKFEHSTKQFEKYQEMKDYGELEWIVLETGELILFALDSLAGKVSLYQYKGASGFVLIDTVKSIGSVSLHPFIRHDDPDDYINHYIALAGPAAKMAYPSQGTEYAKILKSKMKGRRPNLLV